MRVLVLYYSMTGNTEQIAEAIRDEVLAQGHAVRLARVVDTPAGAIMDYDLVFVGSACRDSDLARPALRMLEAMPVSRSLKVAGFATHAAPRPEGGQRNARFYGLWAAGCERSFREASQDKGFELVGYFNCQGAPSPPIEGFVHREIIPNQEEFANYLKEARRHPTPEDVKQAVVFARTVLASCQPHPDSE